VPLDQLPFSDLTTPAGIAAVAVVIRQLVEFAKHSFLPWLDNGNERKGAYIVAAAIYLGWLAVYGTSLSVDGPVALAAFWAAGTAALGTNEAVDAAKGVVAKNVGGTTADMRADAAGQDDMGTPDVDDSVDRSAPLESGPDLDLLVNGGDPQSALEEPPPDPAFAAIG
jgi:hypothetical protein